MTDSGRVPKSLKESIRQFTPAWHTVIMGTGIITILFHNFPYGNETEVMKRVSLVFLLFNFVCFVGFTIVGVTRHFVFREVWPTMIRHPVQSLYLGAFPMGVATLINGAVAILYTEFGFGGVKFLYALWGLFWVDVAISALCYFGLAHLMFSRHRHELSRMTAIWLLPVVTFIVGSSAGQTLAQALQPHSPSHAFLTVVVSAFMVATGLGLSLMIITIYLQRLIVHGVPAGGTIVSVFIILGPLGQAGYSILLMGEVCQTLLPLHNNNSALLTSTITPEILNVMCVCTSFVLWALATVWLIWGLLAFVETLQHTTVHFKLSFWGLIFPNGVYANLTIQLSRTFDSSFFRVYGAIYAVLTLLLWSAISLKTLSLLRKGLIIEAPCVDDLENGSVSVEGSRIEVGEGGPPKRKTG